MRKTLALTGIILLALTAAAEAKPKFLGFWWPSHWRDQDFQPYYEESIGPHNTQWDDNSLSDKNWTPIEWARMDGGNGQRLVQKWFNADILRDDYMKKGVAHIVVGPNFYHLGGSDKRRVMETLDAVYKLTAKSPKMFLIEDWRTDRVIGEYTANNGLSLQ